MRTHFTPLQLGDPHLAQVEANLRACVHCGICTATCPTYVLTGDERDGPRGRIVMMQAMLERGGAPTAETVHHIDRCLSCLGCRTACPSSVDYARLVDAARAHIETHYRRPLADRLLRAFVANVATHPARMRVGLALARAFAPLAWTMPGRFGHLARMGRAAKVAKRRRLTVRGEYKSRVALMPGCAQAALAPNIDEAVTRVLARRGVEAVPLAGAGCCGALSFHLGRSDEAKRWAKRAIESFERADARRGFDAVLIGATGCAAHLKDYANLFVDEPEWRMRAARFAARVRDFSELAEPKQASPPQRLRVAYHAACSLQHGMKIAGAGEALVAAAGHEALTVPEGHLCCGAAGSYAILQPELSGQLRARKAGNIATLEADVVVSGNIGCIVHLSGPEAPPVLHLAELLDWSEGGPSPAAQGGGDAADAHSS